MEASPKIVRDDEEMIRPVRPVPMQPFCGDILYGTPHHPSKPVVQRQAVVSEVTCCVHRRVKPVRFVGIESSDRAGQQEPVHEDFGREHVSEASGVSPEKLLVVFRWELVDKDLQTSLGIVLKHISSAS